jgi:hypothetical protein
VPPLLDLVAALRGLLAPDVPLAFALLYVIGRPLFSSQAEWNGTGHSQHMVHKNGEQRRTHDEKY